MKIERIVLRQIRMPLVHYFETSFGRTTERDMVLVEAVSEGVSGWGEVTAGENPFYNEEWTTSAWSIVRDYAAPRVMGRELGSAGEVGQWTAHIRGHLMARGGLEAAAWDLEARRAARPLWRHIGGGARREIPC
ncbi:MAG: o-succinylbenzoate synthase, partial [Bryobacteraceae bacterium]